MYPLSYKLTEVKGLNAGSASGREPPVVVLTSWSSRTTSWEKALCLKNKILHIIHEAQPSYFN